jgi:hypothetical protein
MKALFTFFAALSFICLAGVCFAGNKPQQSPETAAAARPKTVAKPAADAVVKTSYVINVSARKLEDSLTRKVARAGDIILVEITNPKEFMNTRPADRNRIVLYAEGVELRGITSDLFNNISKEDFKTADTLMWIPFQLKRDTTTKAAWDYLYKLTDSWTKNSLTIHTTVAWEGMLPVKVLKKDLHNTELTLTYFNKTAFIWMTSIYLVLIIALGILIVKSDILKEGKGGAYSLAQTQLAFWTVLVIGGFVYSLILTDIPSTLNTSILILLGISMTTNGTASYIDYYKKVKQGKGWSPKKAENFIADILSDGQSINMQRFQIFAWNIVLGVYFIIYTINNKTMPTFPDVLLYLSGISSFSYVAGKPTEPK